MPDGYVTIATYTVVIDAELARMKLDAQEIPACLLDSQYVGVQPLNAAVLVRLQVPLEDAERAREILASGEAPQIVDEEFLREADEAELKERLPEAAMRGEDAPFPLRWVLLAAVVLLIYLLIRD